MSKVLRQLTVTDRFIEEDPLSVTHDLLTNNEKYQDLVYTTEITQDKAKAYYVQVQMPYNSYVPTAFLFKIRDSNTNVIDASKLDFENDTHQVVKYAEAPYTQNTSTQGVKLATVGYTTDGIRRYHAYTYNQLINETHASCSEEDFNNIQSSASFAQTLIKNHILENFDINATNFKFDLQKIDNSSIDGAGLYVAFDFIFIAKIPWNQFICCYDRNEYDQYVTGGRILDGDNENVYVKIYPFVNDSDLIERTEDFGTNRIFHSSVGEVDKLTLKVYNGTTPLAGIPFYINSQSLKIGPSKQYTLNNIPIYNFGIPNMDNRICVIEYEYNDE